MRVTCRCGQWFTILNEQFPHRVSCHVCGRHFHVLDDGGFIDADDIPDAPAIPNTAIQVDTSSNVTANPPEDTLLAAEAKLNADLFLIDLLWKTERMSHSLILMFGFTILPSKTLSVALGLAFVALCCILFALAISTNNQAWLCPGSIGVAISIFVPIYIYVTAHRLEKAEAKWQSKRAQAIAKSGLLMSHDSN